MQFNSSDAHGRFRPFTEAGAIVPTLYGASDLTDAISESILHDVPVRGPERRVMWSVVQRWRWSTIVPRRDLRLVTLHGAGLSRLQVTHSQLIGSESCDYPATATWGQALYDADAKPDGLCWRSRQNNDSLAVMLFATRIGAADLELLRAPTAFTVPHATDRLYAIAEAAGITIVT